jgi:beta-glucosidase
VADLEARIRAGRVGSIFGIEDPAAVNRLQRAAREESRLGIPLIVGNDVIHGYRTVFPIPLAEACTWNPRLVERAARVAAEEARANGTDWIFAPMVDVSREPRWGRTAEGAGEDTYLGSVMAAARVRGFQSVSHLAACPKHYVAYGAVEAGRDYNSVDISERTLRDVYLPPFKAAFEAGAETVMSSFNEIAGVPATINHLTLRTILRDEWGWQGLVVSDYSAIKELIEHGVAADLKDAARLSILAGIDMDMMSDAYDRHLAALVEEGAVPLSVVDGAVQRVLRIKFGLGLFELPPIDADKAKQALLREESRELALQVARESMVLLENNAGLLPLASGTRVAVVGELAESRRDMLGCWAQIGRAEDVETIFDGLAAQLETPPWFVASDVELAVDAAREADVTVAVVGETADISGEAHSRAHLGLPGQQQALVDALAATGTPLVVVLMTGRPLVLPRVAERAGALLVAWHPGIRAGTAVADVLLGKINPSGRLVASFPRDEGQIPVYYGHKNTGRPASGPGTQQFEAHFRSNYLDEPNSPLYCFGFGLGYTEFEYADLRMESPAGKVLVASATVTNVGSRAGTEVVQLYVRDLLASVTRPVRELKAFERISLEPGEARQVRFEIPVEHLGFTGLDMLYRVEPGEFGVWIGPDASRGLEGTFRFEG